ncbi:cotranscriptional regulator FAM172A homolog isoform X2 [Daphnia pulex]|uniref:cotranscriptional regulator FAM172A homolog isoform X2 n=1 Tax=Daphnia pulex TaxID=6669 RepID=UPI001EDE6096|nr:cotranscriptional regulator FAM172A homolog isoform X2 [Daphnia pulex]
MTDTISTFPAQNQSINTYVIVDHSKYLIPPMDADSFPKTLTEFGYAFNEKGQLRIIDPVTKAAGDCPFEFEVDRDNNDYNQRRYEALGEIINQHIYELLETRGKLTKTFLKKEGCTETSNEIESFIFVSDDVFTNDKLIVLVHGSGVVRAGQWARRLIINDSLDTGTQLPFIEMARQKGYAVIVTNTNDNHRIIDRKKKLIQGSENPVNHLLSVWKQVIDKSPAKHIAFIAHSYGGVCTLELASQVEKKFQDSVFALAMTDSVHSMVHHETIAAGLQQFLCQIGRNWVSSGLPLDTPVGRPANDIDRVSAGHTQHEMTSYCSMSSIFQFLEEKLQEKLQQQQNGQ